MMNTDWHQGHEDLNGGIECNDDCPACHWPGNTDCPDLVSGCDICTEEAPNRLCGCAPVGGGSFRVCPHEVPSREIPASTWVDKKVEHDPGCPFATRHVAEKLMDRLLMRVVTCTCGAYDRRPSPKKGVRHG